MMDNHSWCYLACSRCHKKTDIGVVPFTCGFGKHNDQPVLRYQVEVMVKDKDEDTKFLLWDRECVELIGQSTNEVNSLKMAVCNCIMMCCILIYNQILFICYPISLWILSH